jgi:DNA-binding YbaB/EbfC family protein
MKNPGNLLKGISALQTKMNTIQKELSESIFEGGAANDLVKVTMTGNGELKSTFIDASLLGTEDAETISDLVTVAAGNAYKKKEEKSKALLGGMANGLLPFGMKIPGMA